MQAPKSPKSHRRCLISPEIHDMWETVSTRKHIRLSAQGFHWGLALLARSAKHISKFYTAKGKTCVQHKPHCFTNSLGLVSHSFYLGNGENPSKV